MLCVALLCFVDSVEMKVMNKWSLPLFHSLSLSHTHAHTTSRFVQVLIVVVGLYSRLALLPFYFFNRRVYGQLCWYALRATYSSRFDFVLPRPVSAWMALPT